MCIILVVTSILLIRTGQLLNPTLIIAAVDTTVKPNSLLAAPNQKGIMTVKGNAGYYSMMANIVLGQQIDEELLS